MEKQIDSKTLPTPVAAPSRQTFQFRIYLQRITISVVLACLVYNTVGISSKRTFSKSLRAAEARCPQADVLRPIKNNEMWLEVSREIISDGFKNRAVDWLSSAVRIPTEGYDAMGPIGQDPRWEVFKPFHAYLQSAFPLIHTTLKRTEVNTYGLIYEWVVPDSILKPILFAAHQDVVPVEKTTVGQWTHPPFSGYYDGERIWGRGSADDKSGLIGILTALETLLKNGFKPARTIVLAFGFDEETGGFQGAGNLSKVLLDKYGKDGIALVIDEGVGYSEQYGSYIAGPGIAEKGSVNVRVQVRAPGGHSSVPPAHTSIGILSALLVHFEKHPFDVKLARSQPLYTSLHCVAEHAKNVPSDLRNIIWKSAHSNKALKKLESRILKDNLLKSLVGSTQAIDLIQGGVKSNALPEQAWAIINHRISVTSSVSELKDRDTKLLEPIANKFNLSYTAFGAQISEEGAPHKGSLILSATGRGGLEPAPVTPTGKDAVPYRILSGSIKASFNAHRGDLTSDTSEIIVAPSMMSGNTDTRFYWDLTQHIFRYSHLNGGKDNNPLAHGIHTVNEYIEVDSWLEMIQFYVTLILNADETTEL